MKATELMTSDAMTALPTAKVADALDILQTLEIRHLPIVDNDGQLVGMISDRDIRSGAVPYAASGGDGFLHKPLVEIMTTDVATIGPEADVEEIIDVLLTERIGAVPVIDEASRELLGIVSYVDVLRALRTPA